MNKVDKKAAFIGIFIAKLGDPTQFDHTGEVIDLVKPVGKCVCGHPIRYEYIIKNRYNGKIAKVGSECINNFQDYSPALYASLMKTVERLKEEERKAKELEMNEKVQKVKAELSEKLNLAIRWYKAKYGNHYAPYEIWYPMHREFSFNPNKTYKTMKPLLNWYEKNLKKVSAFVERYVLN